jgi:hypothetical protein
MVLDHAFSDYSHRFYDFCYIEDTGHLPIRRTITMLYTFREIVFVIND